jgi:dihydrofolate synthase/folylpolyglutamate synthase
MEAEGEAPTSFELETAIAFLWFARQGCDAAVIETGLGGRLDATNVIKRPAVSVITSISYDHVNILGDTLGAIAAEKCGIIKPNGITVSYPRQDPEAMAVIRERAEALGNRLIVPDPAAVRVRGTALDGVMLEYGGLALHVPMAGAHQAYNAATAVEALRAMDSCGFPVPGERIASGIARAALPMRQELLCTDPVVLLDGAHNLDKLTALAETMRSHLAGRRTVVVMGMLRDKDYVPSIRLIASFAEKFIACAPQSERALPSSIAADIARGSCADVQIIDDYSRALSEALRVAGRGGVVVVCGSFYLAGPMRKLILRL